MLSSIVKRRMYPDMYGEDLKGCHIAQKILDRLVQKKFPRVSRHFKTLGCELSLVTSEWLLCLFSRSYPMETVARIWDSLLFEGFKIFYRVSLGFIRLHEAKILKPTSLGDLVMFMKDEVKSSVNNEQIMRRAFHGIGGMRSKQIIKYAIMYEEEVDAMLEHYGNASLWNFLFPTEKPPIPRGVTHGDELVYLFSTGVFNLTPMDWEIARVMSNLWANFVIYG